MNVKGTLVRNVVKALRKQHGAVRDRIPPHLEGYLDRHVLPTEWFPEHEYWDLVGVLASVLPPSSDPFLALGAAEAEEHLASTYSAWARMRGSEGGRVLARLPQLWSTHHDTGTMVVREAGATSGVLELVEFGMADNRVCRCIAGYYDAMFRLLEVPGGRVRMATCRGRGDRTCTWSASWAAAVEPRTA